MMKLRSSVEAHRKELGATQVEMAICAFLLSMIVLGIVDVSRMVVVYTALSNAARAGTRYAIVHGGDRTGTGVNGPSSSASSDQVKAVVTNFAGAGLLSTSKLTITISYPDSANAAGSHVTVSVSYPFTPLVGYFPLSVTLGNTSQGIITY